MKNTQTPKVHPVTYVEPTKLKGAKYNPRKIERRELEKLAHNIAVFGFVETVTASKENNEIIGGHQRVKAALMLLKGDYVPKDWKGNPLSFEMPKKVPVIYVEGLSDAQRKTLNLSLNRLGGEWDDDKVQALVKELSANAASMMDDAMAELDKESAMLSALALTGFDDAELKGYLDTPMKGDLPLPPPPPPPPSSAVLAAPPPPPRVDEGVKGVQPNTRVPMVFYVETEQEAAMVKRVFAHAKREYELNGPLLYVVSKWLDDNRETLNNIAGGSV